jgi:hypothetical protein
MKFENGHPFNPCILRSSMRIDSLHAGTVDPRFLLHHGKFGFQLVDSCMQHLAFLDQGFTAREHDESHKADDIQEGISNGCCPAVRKRQWLDIPLADFVTHGGARKSTHHSGSRSRSCDVTDMIDESGRLCFCISDEVFRLCH